MQRSHNDIEKWPQYVDKFWLPYDVEIDLKNLRSEMLIYYLGNGPYYVPRDPINPYFLGGCL
jgi:hypothetical protein